MAVAFLSGDTFTMFCKRGELAWKRRGLRNPYWPLIAVANLAEEEETIGPVTRFLFLIEMQPAVERFLKNIKKPFEILDECECEERTGDLISGETTTLNPSFKEERRKL